MTRAAIPSSASVPAAARQSCTVTPAPIRVDLVGVAAAQHLGAADREGLPGVVQHRVGAAGGPQVGDARAVGHGRDQGGGSGRRRSGTGRSSRARRASWPGPPAPSATARRRRSRRRRASPTRRMSRPGDRRHPDEVVGPGEERREGRGERPVAAHPTADRGGDHLLLGDEHLEVAVGVGLGELVGVGRVADLAVQRDDVAARAQRAQRVAVRLAGGDLLRPARRSGSVTSAGRGAAAGRRGGPRLGRGPRTRRCRSPPSSTMARSAMSSGSGLPCQSALVLDLGNALALDRCGRG